MTKKTFITLANAIRRANHPYPGAFPQKAIETLADFCESQNPAFKRGRWLDYVAGKCGPCGGAVEKKGGAS